MLSIEFETTHVSKYERKSIWKFYCFAVITLQLCVLNGETSAREASIFKDPKCCKTLVLPSRYTCCCLCRHYHFCM